MGKFSWYAGKVDDDAVRQIIKMKRKEKGIAERELMPMELIDACKGKVSDELLETARAAHEFKSALENEAGAWAEKYQEKFNENEKLREQLRTARERDDAILELRELAQKYSDGNRKVDWQIVRLQLVEVAELIDKFRALGDAE